MATKPPDELRRIWLEAVLLPGESNPLKSCLKELSLYLEIPVEEVERRCVRAVEAQREKWNEADRGSEEALCAFYNECDAYLYELLWWHALQQGDAPAWNARLVGLARSGGCRRYLDFGGGIGTNALLLGREGLEVTVADISDVLLRFARWRIERRGLRARFVDLKTEALEPERYDLISAVDVLEHVKDPLATLDGLQAALAPDGLLVFDLIASKPDPDRPFHLLRSKYPIRSRIRSLGFQHVESFQKFLVYRKVRRTKVGIATVRVFDTLKWRAYYLLQGRWPKG